MALGNTPRRETTFAVEANKSYAFGLRFVHPDKTAIDLTGCTLRMVVIEGPHVGGTQVLAKVADMTDPTLGFAQFNLQAEDLALDPGSYSYDVTLLPTSGYSSPIIKGYFEVGPNVDFDSSNKYLGLEVGSEITVTFEQGDVVEITIDRVDGLYVLVAGLMEDFKEEMEAAVGQAETAAGEAAASADLAEGYAGQMQVWLDNAGFPFWKGTQAQYDIITPKAEVLYLITDNPEG